MTETYDQQLIRQAGEVCGGDCHDKPIVYRYICEKIDCEKCHCDEINEDIAKDLE